MKNIVAVLFFLLPCASFAQGEENTVSPKYLRLVKNCCSIEKQEKEQFIIGEMKSSGEEFRKNLFKKRRMQLFADDYNSCHHGANSKCPRLDIVGKPGKLYMLEHKQPF